MTPQEYNACVDLYADKLYRFILKSASDTDVAKDITQESFIRVWEKRNEVRFETAKAYFFKTAYNALVDHFRREKKSVDIGRVNTSLYHVEQPNHQLPELLDEAVQKLPPAQKTILLLRDYEGYSYEEIAGIAGVTLEQVKINLFRARKFLKNYLVSVEAVL
jgi:RNA polymerase sigma factor (sigma-70 family)